MFSGREKTFACLVLLFAASAASAAPTVISANHPLTISPLSDHAAGGDSCALSSDAVCDRMSDLAKAILQPPLPDGRSTAADNRYLPAVPPALVMVLTGFLCISLVRDRKTWLTVLVGLFAIGQAGINALPELSRLGRRVYTGRLIEPELEAPYNLEDGFYPESFSNETQYTGLLHHLEGIPRRTNVFTNNRVSLTRLYLGTTGKDTRASQHAIVPELSSLSTAYDCLVRKTRQFICFTPAFIFSCLSRGPPISPWKTLL